MKVLGGMMAVVLGVVACGGSDLTDPEEGPPTVASIVPAGQATGVDPAAPIVIRFTHPMMAGMERFVALHEGTKAGQLLSGTWTWSSDWTELRFTHAAPLHSTTQYTIHIGGGMRDRANRELDHVACGVQGGVNAPAGMMGGSGMMGDGWRHSINTVIVAVNAQLLRRARL